MFKLMTKIQNYQIKISRVFLILFALGGCTSQYSRNAIENEDFLIITANNKDTFETLASEFLGDSTSAELLLRFNPGVELSQGVRIAIPKQNLNNSHVFFDGYQTIPILCYHQFTDSKTARSRMVVPIHEFKEQMSYLADNNFNVISLTQYKKFIDGDIALPKKSVVITVDDGYRSFLEFALPILEEYKFPSTVFVYPEFIGGRLSLTWDEVKQLEKNSIVSIESHSTTHSNLSKKSRSESLENYKKRLKGEVKNADKILKSRIGKRPTFFAYPYGDSSTQLIDILNEQNYDLAFTVKRGSNSAFSSRYMLNRNMIFGGHSLNEFKRVLAIFKRVDLL